jgi:SAM-dependent methyltransferase
VHALKMRQENYLDGRKGSLYDVLAGEYYDAEAHPTCHNLNQLSRAFLARRLTEPWERQSVLEVGSGSSSVAAILHSRGYTLDDLTISDDSESMIAHSLRWQEHGARLLLCSASAIPFREGAFSLVVSGLGDPYNEPQFWREAHRVMSRGARILFTMPSFHWAIRFRGAENPARFAAAEFELRDGSIVDVPSFIPRLEVQIAMMERAGFTVLYFESLGAEALDAEDKRSPKINVFPSGWSSIVWGFESIRTD